MVFVRLCALPFGSSKFTGYLRILSLKHLKLPLAFKWRNRLNSADLRINEFVLVVSMNQVVMFLVL